MTNKEAAEILKNEDCYECTFGGFGNNCKCVGCEVHQALNKAIEALEKGCEKEQNTRPRAQWLPFRYDYDLPANEYGEYVQIIKDPKKTHWEEYWAPEFICSNCHAKNHNSKFCPHCGAQMERGESDD